MDQRQCRDTGMALALLALAIGIYTGNRYAFIAALTLLALTLVMPRVLTPLAVFWFGLAHVLGRISSPILLGLVYFLLVTPVGLVRRSFGWDPLASKRYRKSTGSAFEVRDHIFGPGDLEQPF